MTKIGECPCEHCERHKNEFQRLKYAVLEMSEALDLITRKSKECNPDYDCAQFNVTERHAVAIKLAGESYD